ncbi:hypothetical protein C1645_831717 [Glomus cerebriforme]|uniref:Uncharacterized protein n=1 Tax=Glomus cerebriforme TaxID=658196 RepID=A0A397SPR5_9GLOM|nr:hypothetical protein C1645_831717 [Glomus cerebriforme]
MPIIIICIVFLSKTVFEWEGLPVNEDMNIEEFFKDVVACELLKPELWEKNCVAYFSHIKTSETDKIKLHYGPFAINWWFFTEKKTQTAPIKQICIPICVNMRLKFELNQTEFIIRVVENNWKPGYICELDMETTIYSTPSFDNETIIEQLQAEILLFSLQITVHGITVFVITLGSSDQAELNFAGSGYCLSFYHKYHGQYSLICQSIMNAECQISIYHQEKKIQMYTGKSPTDPFKLI